MAELKASSKHGYTGNANDGSFWVKIEDFCTVMNGGWKLAYYHDDLLETKNWSIAKGGHTTGTDGAKNDGTKTRWHKITIQK